MRAALVMNNIFVFGENIIYLTDIALNIVTFKSFLNFQEEEIQM